MAFLVGGANSSAADTGYDVENSCRFDEASDASLGGTFGTPTEAKAFTLSMWFKRAGMMGTIQALLGCGPYEAIIIQNEKMTIFWDNVSAGRINWAPLLRDHSAWYHFVIAQDTAQGTDTNRVKFYLNGTQITTLGGYTSWPAQDVVGGFNEDGQAFYISTYNASGWAAGGYCAEVAFIDGLQYAASNFGERNDDGIWIPKEFKDDVTFGNNGFYLEFKQSGVDTDASGLGADTSGNDNHLALSNLAATDQSTDTPTNNFATANSLTGSSTLSEGNCKVACADNDGVGGTFGVSNGKWYVEAKATTDSYTSVGISKTTEQFGRNLHSSTNTYMYSYVGSAYKISVLDGTPDTYTNGDIITLMIDCDNNKLFFKKNDSFITTSEGTHDGSSTGISIDDGEFYTTANTANGNTGDSEWNFGSPPFAISSGNADANGYGNFEYAVPSGYYALCTKNLAEYG